MNQHVTAADEYPDELTEAEAAEYLGTFVTRILRLRDAGAFGRSVDTAQGPTWRVRRTELDAWLEQQAATFGDQRTSGQ